MPFAFALLLAAAPFDAPLDPADEAPLEPADVVTAPASRAPSRPALPSADRRKVVDEGLPIAGSIGCGIGGGIASAIAVAGCATYCQHFGSGSGRAEDGARMFTTALTAMGPAAATGSLAAMLIERVQSGRPIAPVLIGALPALVASGLSAVACGASISPQYIGVDETVLMALATAGLVGTFASGPLTILGAKAAAEWEAESEVPY